MKDHINYLYLSVILWIRQCNLFVVDKTQILRFHESHEIGVFSYDNVDTNHVRMIVQII